MGYPFSVFRFLNSALASDDSTLTVHNSVSSGSFIFDNSANCRRQCGHQYPRKKMRTKFFFPFKLDKFIILPVSSSPEKFGAISPMLIAT